MTAEQPLPINPLPVPAAGQPPEDVIQSPAAELFWTRTGLAGLPAGEQADAVVRICQRVDGLPLALEIAAARTTVLTIGELADTLGGRAGHPADWPVRGVTRRWPMPWSAGAISC